jgi:DNA-binding NarL/FixJ family response regulator
MPPIRLLIADDHLVVRQGLHSVLTEAGDIVIVAEARNGEEAIAQARRLQPDVILMDLSMPGVDGIEATRQILREQPGAKIVALTYEIEDDRVVQAVRAGMVGIWSKDAEYDDLVRVIRDAHAGKHPVHPKALDPLLRARRAPDADRLSERERDVLNLIGQGLGNRDIAARLNLSEATVKGHVSHMLDKLGMKNRAQLALYAERQKSK